MNTKAVENPFGELPQALIEEMLFQCEPLVEGLMNSFKKLDEEKQEIRERLISEELLHNDNEISISPYYPTTCGVDGAIAMDKLISTDMVGIAALAVEGLTPPTEKRHWPIPRHLSEVISLPHNESTYSVSRALMICMELCLAMKAPHDTVFLDGSLITPFIFINQAMTKKNDVSRSLSAKFDEIINSALESYLEILKSKRTDRIFLGIPKYTSRKEISIHTLHLPGYEDRGLLSFVLDAGEYVGPKKISPFKERWPQDRFLGNLNEFFDEISSASENLYVIYYRPYYHLPALRIEIPRSVAKNTQRLSILFESIRIQCGVPGIMEPYPLYLADRMVKHLGSALPAIRRTATQEMVIDHLQLSGDIYLAMHGYRTEWIRGGG